LVALTDGAVYPRKLTWNGNKRNAPDTPPIEVKKDTMKATKKGTSGWVSTPDTENSILVNLSVFIKIPKQFVSPVLRYESFLDDTNHIFFQDILVL
jgi:hypothetical protein